MVDLDRIKKKRVFVLVGAALLFVAMASATRFLTPNMFHADWYSSVPFQEGTSYTTWSFFSINSTQARADYDKMRASGVEWVAINSYWYQANLTSTVIYPGFWTEPRENLVDAFLYARSIGLHVLYKPMIQVETGEWRAWIQYSPGWMEAYKAWLVSCAEDAELGGVEIFCIGCEMNNMQGHSDAIRAMIAGVREVFHGKLTYSTNYDSFWYIDWYDAIDMIGISMYPAMSFDYAPTTQTLVQFWNGFYTRMEALSAKWNLPIAFTEIGAEALDGANMSPSHDQISTQRDVEELCDIYRSVFESKIWTAPWFKGVYWWIWDNYEPDPAHPELDINFSPEIPAVLAILTAKYTTEHQYVPSDFPFRLLVPLSVGIVIFIVLAWKLDFQPRAKNEPKKEMVPPETRPAFSSSPPTFPPAKLAVGQGSLVGIFVYLVYSQITFPSYVTLYYRPDDVIWFVGIALGTILLSRLFLHHSSHLSVQVLLLVPFTITFACPAIFFGIGIDVAWLKLLCDMGLLGTVIVAIVRINGACPRSEKGQHKYTLTASLLTFLFLLTCSVFFDQMALNFASVPIGVSLLMLPPGLAQNPALASDNAATTSDLAQNHVRSARGLGMRQDISLLLLAVLAGLLLPIASSSFNLLYMNLLPLVLSILPPVFAAGLFWGIYLLWSRYHKRHDSKGVPEEYNQASSTFPSSLRQAQLYSLALEGLAAGIVLANVPHLFWSLLAGVFVILFLSTIQFQITRKVQNHEETKLFYFLFLAVLMIGAGTIVHAMKGSQIYSITSPILYDLVKTINLVVLGGCFVLTFVSLILSWKGWGRR